MHAVWTRSWLDGALDAVPTEFLRSAQAKDSHKDLVTA